MRVLSNEWLEELFAPVRQQPLVPRDQARQDRHTRWAPRDLWNRGYVILRRQR